MPTLLSRSAATTPVAGTDLVYVVQDPSGTPTEGKLDISDLTAGRNVDGTSFTVTGSTVPVNGAYLPAPNTLGFATDSTLRVSISTTAVVSTLPFSSPLGAVGTPTYTFTGDLNTGIWSSAADTLDFSAGGVRALQLNTIASGVDYLTIGPAAAGGRPFFLTAGATADIGLNFIVKGAQNIGFLTGSSLTQLTVAHAASAVNRPQISGSPTGTPVTYGAAGSDTDIDILLSPKGAGLVRMGVYTADAAATIAGYITIKDAAGNSRKVLIAA